MRFPPSFIDRLRSQLLVSQVVGKRVPLKKHGREMQGLCPFHKEKSPSFTVNDEKGFYHCFGCGAHGDGIKFIMEFDKLSYPETIQMLARDLGMPIPEMLPGEMEKERQAASLQDVMEAACCWFEQQLQLAAGQGARDYLATRRLTAQTQKTFRLGFAPNQRDALKQALLKVNIKEAQLIEAGLLIQPDNGPSYDRFRNRVMFPIRDARGRVIAFGGRIMPSLGDSVGPKYLNSPDTPLFHKGEVLYNLDLARKPGVDAQQIIVAEGYMDVIALAQAGIHYVVAPLGTAVTETQLQMLWRVAPEPVMCLDGDAAGMRAMARTAERVLPLLKPGLSLRFALLPQGDDPDSLIKQAGAEAFQEIIKTARNLSRVLWEASVLAVGTDTPERKAALEQQLMQLAERIADASVKQHYRNYFRERLWPQRKQEFVKGKPVAKASASHAPLIIASEFSPLQRLEQQIMKTLLLCPQLLHLAEIEDYVAHFECTYPPFDALRQSLITEVVEKDVSDEATLHQTLREQGQGEIVKALLNNENIPLSRTPCAPEQAEPFFRKIMAAHSYLHLQSEYHEAVQTMAVDMTDAAYERVQGLQKQLETLQMQSQINMDVEEAS